jgi:hypothetical protein
VSAGPNPGRCRKNGEANHKPPPTLAYRQSAPMQFRQVSPQPAVEEVS